MAESTDDPGVVDGIDSPAVEPERRDLSGEDDRASQAGVVRPDERPPPPDHVRSIASYLLLIFGISMILILLLTTAVAWWRMAALKDVINFFGTVVATMGTLLGGVVAFYFARR